MDEFQIIRQFFDRPLTDSSVRIGVGDDGAVLSTEPNREVVTVVDTLVEGVHFPAGFAPDDIGYRALAVNLSDIAAMGARPRWMTLALTLENVNDQWLHSFAAGLFAAADEFAVSLVGGDTTRGSQTVISVQLMGDIETGNALSRSGASSGDGLFLSGTVGDAALGLSLMESGRPPSAETEYLRQRFSRPSARVSLGQALARLASAAIDISDGLYADTAKMLANSKVGGCIETRLIPLSKEFMSMVKNDDTILKFALAGGDDYELCFTAPPKNEADVLALSNELDIAITRIGELRKGEGLICTRDGSETDYADAGYRHFQGNS